MPVLPPATPELRFAALKETPRVIRRVIGLGTVVLIGMSGIAIPAAAQAATPSVSTIPVGDGPDAIALAPDGTVYTANDLGGTVTRIAAPGTSEQAVTTIAVGSRPGSVAIAPDGTVYTANGGDNTVSRIVAPGTSGQTVTTIPVGDDPASVAVDSDGTVYTADLYSNTVTRIAAPGTDQQTISTIPVGNYPEAVAVALDGTVYAYNANLGIGPTITRISDPGTVAQSTTTINPILRGSSSYTTLAIASDGTVFASNGSELARIAHAGSSDQVITKLRAPSPSSLKLGPDNALYAFSSNTRRITKITTPTSDDRVTSRLLVDTSPTDGVVAPDGTIYTANINQDTVTRYANPAFTTLSPVFTAASPTAGEVGAPYSYTFAAEAPALGVTASQFTVAAGDTLPAGLTLDPVTGVLSGTPTAAGATTFRVVATNSAGTTTTSPLTLVINPTPVPPVFTAASPTATGTVGTAYSYTFTASGVPAPTFAVAPGDVLPDGLTLDATTGVLSGTPTTVGSSTFRVIATNSAGTATSDPITIVVAPAPVAALTAPMITTPRPGQVVDSPVTLTGTGTPGDLIALVTYPTGTPPRSSQLVDDALAAKDPIQVAADGTWSAKRTVAAGDTTAFAVAFTRDSSGVVRNTSAPSARVEFTVAASTVAPGPTPVPSTAPTATAPVPVPRSGSGALAFTGADKETLLGAGATAAVLIAAGFGTLLRRRRAS